MSQPTSRSVSAVLPGLLLAMFLGAIDLTIMAPALPAVAQDLGGLDQIPLVVTGYLLAATVMMPIYGKLGDRFGRKPIMLASIGLFTAGAAMCIFASSMAQLAAFRAVQGLGGGGLSIGTQAIIGEIISPRERGRYLGYIGAAYVVAAVGGPLLGGFLIDQVGWRGIFVIYLPLGLAAAALLGFTLRLPRPQSRLPVDYAGALSLAAAVVGVVLFGQTRNVIFAGLAVVGLVAWLLTARVAADPVLPLRLFRDRGFAIPVSVSFLIGFALFGVITYLPTFLQVTSGLTATTAGLVLTALMAGVLISTVASGRLITRTGRYKIYPVIGTAAGAIGLLLLAILLNKHRPLAIAAAMIIVGLRDRTGDAGDGPCGAERCRLRRPRGRDLLGHLPTPDRRIHGRRHDRRRAPRWRSECIRHAGNPHAGDHRIDGTPARAGVHTRAGPAGTAAPGDRVRDRGGRRAAYHPANSR
jgi:MFS family permease